MSSSKSLRLASAGATVAVLLAAFVACSSEDASEGDGAGSSGEAPSAFTPGEAAPMPPIAPGAAPAAPAPPTGPEDPPDAKPPVVDSGVVDAPVDVVSQ